MEIFANRPIANSIEMTAEKDAASWKAREEALALGLKRKDGARYRTTIERLGIRK